jgi:hypothetical protein
MAYHLIANEASAATNTSWYMRIEDAKAFALQFSFAGTVTGTFTFFGSCKRIEQAQDGGLTSPSTGPWDEFTDLAKTISTEPSWLIDFPEGTGAAWIKVTWTKSGSPTGTISAYGHTKGG